MSQNEVCIGDAVLDVIDPVWRIVIGVWECGTVFMKDGGCMSIQECRNSEIMLESEYTVTGDFAEPIK